jgi:hypothetical protein
VAESVDVAPSGAQAKIRNPWGVLGLSLITLGIYYVFWWYFINREMRDFGRANDVDLGESPGVSVLAITLGALVIVPPFVSIWGTGRRMEGAQRTAGTSAGSGPLFFVLHIIPIVNLFALVYMQTELNKAWRAIGDQQTSRASELSAAPEADLGPVNAEPSQPAGSGTPVTNVSDEGDHPEPTPTDRRQDDAP